MSRHIVLPYPPNPKITDASDYNWKSGKPFLFIVTEPTSSFAPLYDVALALHVNPESLEERMTKSKTVSPTYGGFVEFVWPDDLDSVSASGSTGGFISPKLGYTAAQSGKEGNSGTLDGRQGTMAYERFQDFLELFHQNGMVFDSTGKPAIRGRVVMLYDRGAFSGHFSTFSVEEDESMPFRFNLTWEFKIEKTIYRFSSYSSGDSLCQQLMTSEAVLAYLQLTEYIGF